MRAAAWDSRALCPPANQWTLQGGAYLDGEDIVFPTYFSVALAWLPAPPPGKQLTISNTIWAPADYPDGRAWNLRALGHSADRTLLVPSRWAYHALGIPREEWSRNTWTINTDYTPPAARWVRVTVGNAGGEPFGVLGTRYRPSPLDWTWT